MAGLIRGKAKDVLALPDFHLPVSECRNLEAGHGTIRLSLCCLARKGLLLTLLLGFSLFGRIDALRKQAACLVAAFPRFV